MPCCLSKASEQQLRANLWRAKTILSRNRKKLVLAFLNVIIYTTIVIVLSLQDSSSTVNVDAKSSITVTSTNPVGDANFFNSTTLLGNYSLPNCSRSDLQNVGYVMSTKASSAERTAVSQMNEVIGNSFQANNPSTSLTMGFQRFNTSKQLNSATKSVDYQKSQLCFAYGFSTFNLTTSTFDIDLYFDSKQIGDTHMNQTAYQEYPFYVIKNGDTVTSGDVAWDYTGFQQLMTLATQQVISAVQVNSSLPTDGVNFAVAYLPMNTGDFTFDAILKSKVLFYSILILMLILIPGNVKRLFAEEDENYITVMLRLSGQQASVEVVGDWTIKSCVILPAILFISLVGTFFALKNVSWGINLLLILMFYVQITLLFTVFDYSFSKVTGLLVKLAYFFVQLIAGFLKFFQPTITPNQVYFFSFLFPNMQIQYFGQLAINLQLDPKKDNTTINITNLNQSVLQVTFSSILWIGFFNICLFSLILLYVWPLLIDVDLEKDLKFYYPLTSSYWCPDKAEDRVEPQRDEEDQLIQVLNSSNANSSMETLQVQEQILIQRGDMEGLRGNESSEKLQITDLTKKFVKMVAVNKLSLTLFKDQILVLLGHNGAGKTTTINMLTGHIKATEGAATAYGRDLLKLESSTNLISVCPQTNVLLTKMTVKENLIFFSMFRGSDYSDQIIEQLLDQFNMRHQQDQYASDLSGGQKRKLQLMISILGDSKIILLDEPSSGMDPNTRRETWKILKEVKLGKIIIMTTHYMDEAEELGDRVAIMSYGTLKTCGSPLFLKNKFSDAFLIEIVKANPNQGLDQFEELLSDYLKQVGVERDQLACHIDEAGKQVYTVPKQLGQLFQPMFNEVDSQLDQLNIAEYVVRTSSLEEVFAKIGDDEKLQDQNGESHDSSFVQQQSQNLEMTRQEFGEQSNYRTLNALIRMNSQSRIGQCCVSVVLGLILTSIPLITLFLSTVTQPTIQLSNVQSVFGGVDGDSGYLQAFYCELMPFATNTEQVSFWEPNSIQLISQQNCQNNFDASSTITTLQNYANQIQNTYSNVLAYGGYFVYQVPASTTSGQQLSVAVYGNLESISSQNVYGAIMLNYIAQYYTGNTGLKINFNNQPLAQNTVIVTQTQVGLFLNPFSQILLILGSTVTIMSITVIGSRFDSGFYNQIMQKCGSKGLYVISVYTTDVIAHLVLVWVVEVYLYLGGVRVSKWWFASLLFALSNPLFCLVVSYFTQYAKGYKMRVTLGVIGIFTTFLYFENTLMTSVIYDENTETLVNIAGLILGFMPLANWINSLAHCLLPNLKAQYNNVPLGTYRSFELMRPYLIAQALCIVMYAIFLYFILIGTCSKKQSRRNLRPQPVKDEDKLVVQERNRVNGETGRNDIVRATELVKLYPGKDPNPSDNPDVDRPVDISQSQALDVAAEKPRAVNGVSFGVQKGEVFALLGVSGAGKSSTLNMVLGDEDISGGNASINGADVSDSLYRQAEKMYGLVGFCPQENPLQENLTVRQVLWYFGEFVGIKKDRLDQTISDIIERFDLKDHENKASGTLSGGNKRKLVCAQACIGNPKVLIVDEVSAGVDPVARRKIWKAMRHEAQDSAMILTTHTMEEAEALSTKIGIMVNGRFKCFGSLQQIQQAYGSGFEIEMNLRLEELNQELEVISEEERFNFDIAQIKARLGIWQAELQKQGVQLALDFVEEFSRGGIYCNLLETVSRGQKIDLAALQRDIQVQNEVALLVQELSEKVSDTSVISFDGSYLVLRLQKKQGLTYGALYGYMEMLKERFSIKEYSCKQATLEQIFNSFAKLEGLRIFNERVSQQRRPSLN